MMSVRVVVLPILSVLAALAVGGILIAWVGEDPIEVYRIMLTKSLLEGSGWRETMILTVPLGLIGLGLAFGFRAGVWNIGAEGQLVVGALLAITVVGHFPNLPGIVLIPLGLLAGVLGGALWGALAGFLHVRFELNAVIVTLLLVFVALPLLNWAVRVPLKDPASFLPQSRTVGNAALPAIPGTDVHIGFLLLLVLVPIGTWLLAYTRFGFLVRAHGANRFAVYANETTRERLPFLLLVISGGLAGAAGFVQLAGVQSRVGAGTAAGFGFTAVIVAILGRSHPVGVLVAALGLSAMLVGAEAAQRSLGLPVVLMQSIQAMMVIFLVAGEALEGRRHRQGSRDADRTFQGST